MYKDYNKKNNKEALKALMNIGMNETKILIEDFMNGNPKTLSLDEGLLISLYLNYHNEDSDLKSSINSFIGLIFFKGLKK
jgi:hypothetical protein